MVPKLSQITLQLHPCYLKRSSHLKEQVTTAELYFKIFIAEHNLAFSDGDHFPKLCKKMFLDSKIAEGFACGATKTQAIIKNALAPALNENVIEACASSPFTIIKRLIDK